MSGNPRVSVLMPVYNGEKYLAQALESIEAQTFTDYEIICVDDGSTDRSAEVLQAWQDERLRVIRQENGGVVSALNTGLRHCRGEYIARMDCDDIAEPGRLELQVVFLDQHRDVVAAGSFMKIIDAAGKVVDSWHIPASPQRMQQRLYLMPPLFHPTVMFRRQPARKCGDYPDVKHVEDYALWMRLARVGKLANIPETLLQYRVHSGNVSETARATQQRNHRALRRQLWQTRPRDERSAGAMVRDVRRMLDQETVAAPLRKIDDLIDQLRDDLIWEANLAYGVGRDDIGLRCLIQLCAIDLGRNWKRSLNMAKQRGFASAWRKLRNNEPAMSRCAPKGLFEW